MQNKFYIWGIILLSVLLSGTYTSLNAQEYLTETSGNAQLKKLASTNSGTSQIKSTKTVSLPFIDDFSNLTLLPDPEKWADQMALINDNYAVNQPTIGVATLDAVKANGDLHNFPDTANVMPGDTLTSLLIDASELTPADSIYLTFFVQGGGMGNTPQEKDSIILQMYSKGDTNQWLTLWSKPGVQMENFEAVRIPITAQTLLHDSTQFRFINFFSMEYAGMNCDHWNIDYVHMDKNRSATDSLINEVAYTENINNIFGTYSAIPWRHFKSHYGQILDKIYYRFRNYSEETMSITPYMRWTNLYTEEKQNIGNIADNYEPNTYYNFYNPINGSLFILDDNDSAKFKIENRFFISETDYAPNNQTSRIIDLYNYYAYDDGTAEGMYGVSNKYGMIAVKYNTFSSDSLKAIRIYFNKSENNDDRYFNIMVWDQGGSGPGEVIYKKTRNLPAYSDTLNGFVTYELDSAVAVGETFYIGWQKITNQRLNMGFDKNYVTYQKNYYNSNGLWELSGFDGSLMIRPVLREMFAYKDSFLPEEENVESTPQIFSIYPNPISSGQKLHIDATISSWDVQVFDQTGRMVLQNKDAETIDFSNMTTGLYIIRLFDGQSYYTYKIIKE